MEWLWAAFWAWFGWNVLAPVAAIVVVMTLIVLAVLPGVIRRSLRRSRCKHPKYFENNACHAICSDCRKDLGFIGTVREQRVRG